MCEIEITIVTRLISAAIRGSVDIGKEKRRDLGKEDRRIYREKEHLMG